MPGRLAGRGSLLAGWLLVLAVCHPAVADPPPLTALLKPLDLVGYASHTLPPQFSGRTLDGRSVAMTDHRGKVVLLNFWASWCRECRPEMPVLERIHRELASRGLTVLGVNAREDEQAVGHYARELGLTFPIVLDPRGHINAAYGVIGLPTTFLIGRDGRAVAFAVGAREWGTPGAWALIETLLAEPPPGAP